MATAFGSTAKRVRKYVPAQQPPKVSFMQKFPLSAHNHIIRINACSSLFTVKCVIAYSQFHSSDLIGGELHSITALGCLTVFNTQFRFNIHLNTCFTPYCCNGGGGGEGSVSKSALDQIKRKKQCKYTKYLEFMSFLLKTTQIIYIIKREKIGIHPPPSLLD